MKIAQEIRKSVFFVCINNSKASMSLSVVSTGFILSSPIEDKQEIFINLITAKHVIDAARKYSADGIAYVRMNTVDGGYDYLNTSLDDWIFHPTDPSADVALFSFVPPERFDYLALPENMAITEKHPKHEQINLGDDVLIIGLFVNHFGRQKNIPLIRTGNIAAMLEEPVDTVYGSTDMYLIESRSIGGLSGSPVFVQHPVIRVEEGQVKYNLDGVKPTYFLGLIHGHFDIKLGMDSFVPDFANQSVNRGIAMVVPAQKILETIHQPKIETIRAEFIKNLNRT